MTNLMPPYPIFTTIDAPPPEMDPWQTRIDLPQVDPSRGTFELVYMGKCDTEQHHAVEVIDEDDQPLWGVNVIFGYPGQTTPDLSYLKPKVNYWVGAPAVLAGEARKTGFDGKVMHTTGPGGGEDIWIWYVTPDPLQGGRTELHLSSVIVRNCKSIVDVNAHTGVHLIFRRQQNLANVASLP
jgi:hypothetical protein